MQAIPLALADALRSEGGNILLDNMVSEIHQDPSGVTVVAGTNADTRVSDL